MRLDAEISRLIPYIILLDIHLYHIKVKFFDALISNKLTI